MPVNASFPCLSYKIIILNTYYFMPTLKRRFIKCSYFYTTVLTLHQLLINMANYKFYILLLGILFVHTMYVYVYVVKVKTFKGLHNIQLQKLQKWKQNTMCLLFALL